ncbi:hypothetical protein Tco_1536890, partial [Tanacetum coccineum]
CVSKPTKEQKQPSFANTNKQVKTPRETIKNHFTHSKNPNVDKKSLGYGFATRACFVYGSLSHLIRECDFHEKKMAKQVELNTKKRKDSSQRKIRPTWNNVQRVNHQNQFVPTAVLTRTGKIPVNTARASSTNNVSTARHNFNRQAVPSTGARKVITVKPMGSTFGKSLNKTTAFRTNFSNQKVNTAKDYPYRALQNKGIVDSRCSRHITGNKAYLAEYGHPVTDQAKQIKHLKAQIKKLQKKAKPRRKTAKAEPSVHKDPAFDEFANDIVDNMETENAQDEGRTRSRVSEEKETANDEVSTEDVLNTAQQQVSTDRPNVSTDRPNVSTNRPRVSTDKEEVSTDRQNEGTDAQTDEGTDTQTPPTTTTPFGDDETIAQVL